MLLSSKADFYFHGTRFIARQIAGEAVDVFRRCRRLAALPQMNSSLPEEADRPVIGIVDRQAPGRIPARVLCPLSRAAYFSSMARASASLPALMMNNWKVLPVDPVIGRVSRVQEIMAQKIVKDEAFRIGDFPGAGEGLQDFRQNGPGVDPAGQGPAQGSISTFWSSGPSSNPLSFT